MTSQEKANLYVAWAFDHWAALVVGVISTMVLALVVILLVELRKRFISKKTEAAVSGWVIQKAVWFFSALFVGLDYFVPFLQQNLSFLQSIKWVAPYVATVVAVANGLYAFKAKSWVKAIYDALEAKAAKKAAVSDAATVQSQPLEQPTPQPLESPFEAQA